MRDWRTRRRREVASTLLRRGVHPAAVACRVGYLSESAFRRTFKDWVETIPSEYARRFATPA